MRSRQIGSTSSRATNWEISIARESSALLERLEILVLDDHELPFGHLPALHELVRADLAVVLAGTTASA